MKSCEICGKETIILVENDDLMICEECEEKTTFEINPEARKKFAYELESILINDEMAEKCFSYLMGEWKLSKEDIESLCMSRIGIAYANLKAESTGNSITETPPNYRVYMTVPSLLIGLMIDNKRGKT